MKNEIKGEKNVLSFFGSFQFSLVVKKSFLCKKFWHAERAGQGDQIGRIFDKWVIVYIG
jgi:hypothetical protein